MNAALGYLVLVAMAAGMLVSYTRPWFCFVAVLCLYPLKQLQMTYMPVFAANSSYFNFLVAAWVGAGVLGNLIRSRDVFTGYMNKSMALLLVLYGYVLLCVLWSAAPENAMARIRDGAAYWVMQVLLFPLCFNNLNDFRKTFAPTIVVGAVVCFLFFINPNASYFAGRLTLRILGAGEEMRGNPLATAQLGGQIAIIAVLMLPQRATWLMHAIRLGAIFTGLGLAVAAGSRGQLALALLSMVLFYPMARKVKDLKTFFATAVGVGVFGALAFFTLSLFLKQDVEQATRWNLAEWGTQAEERSADAFRLVVQYWESPGHWLLGLGTNSFSAIRGESLSYAHNVLVEVLCENGIVGLVMYLTITWWVFKDHRDLWRAYAEDPVGRATVACLAAQGLYLTLLSYKQGTFVGLPEPYYLWVLASRFMYRERVAERALAAEIEHDALPGPALSDSRVEPA